MAVPVLGRVVPCLWAVAGATNRSGRPWEGVFFWSGWDGPARGDLGAGAEVAPEAQEVEGIELRFLTPQAGLGGGAGQHRAVVAKLF